MLRDVGIANEFIVVWRSAFGGAWEFYLTAEGEPSEPIVEAQVLALAALQCFQQL